MISRFLSVVFFSTLTLFVLAQDIAVDREVLGKVTDSRLNELSGIVASRKMPNMFWTHNDSGDSARIFLIDSKAKLRCIFSLEGVDAVDVEDIAWYEKDGKSYLVLADIGDNRGIRKDIQLYIFEEPEWQEGNAVAKISQQGIKRINMRYEDKPRDAEALFVDPFDKKAYLISKRDLRVGVYPIDFESARSGSSLTLKRRLTLPMTFITAADVAADGSRILIKNIGQVFLWERRKGMPILEAFAQNPLTLAYQAEPQGEAICFGADNHVFYTVSERPLGLEAYLYGYKMQPSSSLY
ncbi:hypothetical protein [Sphingobacterium deserti]|nr:hypothetical protein [Sphingobacterium deserti]